MLNVLFSCLFMLCITVELKKWQQLLVGVRHRWESMVCESPSCEFPSMVQIFKKILQEEVTSTGSNLTTISQLN